MPVREGNVGERNVLVLRDSGLNSVLLKDSLVKSEEMTGKAVNCVMADGSRRMFPLAWIKVSTPFLWGI